MSYACNKHRARTRNTDPSLTDQSQAKDTDINVIVGRYGIGGRVPAAPLPLMSGDFTNLPTDLRGFIETANTLKTEHGKLPKELRHLSVHQLMSMTTKQIADILAKPATPPVPKEGTTT